MICDPPRPFYHPWSRPGLKVVKSAGDGYSMLFEWSKAFADPSSYSIAYNIYYSTTPFQSIESDFISTIAEGPKFISTDLKATILDFTPGTMYYFVVRATQYDPDWYDINDLLPDLSQDGYIKVYPETLLASDISELDTEIPITDIELFPNRGVIKIGHELIRYSDKDELNNSLIDVERGFFETEPRLHTTDGYDGIKYHDPVLKFWEGIENRSLYVVQEQSTFELSNIYTVPDGYRNTNREGILTVDYNQNDEERAGFPAYDFVGWRRTDPKRFFQGGCVDSYIGGENFCADGYNGLNQQIRGIPFNQQADRLQEMLLEQLGTGETVVLLRRLWKGITCRCYTINQEYPDKRCGNCFGTSFVGGYEQYYNPRRKDSRILVRFGPATEDIKTEDAGLENHIIYDCWTLTYPALDDRDVIIRFNPDGTEEFRYEILDVTRNRLLFNETGNQKFRAQRIRKTSSIYQWRAIRSTLDEPTPLSTTVGLLRGPNNIVIPHIHTLTISNNTIVLSQINQTTDVAEGHSHPIINGQILPILQHSHDLIL